MTSLSVTGASQAAAARRWLLLASAVLLLAVAFRLVALDQVPPGLAQDEVLDADIALFIRQGERALFFRHGYGHEPLYHYLAAPFGMLYGDNLLAARLPSVYLGLLLVAATLHWARRNYGRIAALVAGAGLALSWWPVIFSRIGIRPILMPLLLVAAAGCWPLRCHELTRRGLLSAALAGAWLGLSLYSYTAARVAPLIPLGLLVVAMARALLERRRGRSESARAARAQAVYALVVLIVCLLVYAPLGLTLRANPELQQRLAQLGGPLDALRAGDPVPVARSTLATLGVFSFTGDPRWTYTLPNRPLFDPLMALLFYAGLALALWRWRRPVYALLPVWLFVALLPSALSPDAPSTVRLVGALPVVYVLPGLAVNGLARWWRRMAGRRSLTDARAWSLGLAAVLLALLVWNAARTVRDGFGRWPADLETRLRYQTVIRDIGRYWLVEGGGAAPVVAEVFYEPIDEATLRRDVGRDPAARWVQTSGVAGALVWPAGEDSPWLYVPEYAPLNAELAAAAGVLADPLYRSPSGPSFAVYALPAAPAANVVPVMETFGAPPVIALRGLTAPQVAPGDALTFLTYWEVEDRLPADLAVFVHLIDPSGAVVAQHDGLDAAAETLMPSDRVLQRHSLQLPAGLSGEYELVLGLYRRGDGQRLPASEGDSLRVALCRGAGGHLACDLPNTR